MLPRLLFLIAVAVFIYMADTSCRRGNSVVNGSGTISYAE